MRTQVFALLATLALTACATDVDDTSPADVSDSTDDAATDPIGDGADDSFRSAPGGPAPSGVTPIIDNVTPVIDDVGEGVGAPTAYTAPNTCTNGICYHGGSVMTGTVNVYFIYYGFWWNNPVAPVLSRFVKGVGSSLWYNVNRTYDNAAGTHVSSNVVLAKTTTVGYPQGSALTGSSITTIVSNAINDGRLPKDPNGVYFVLTSSDVTMSGFCTQFCGYHNHMNVGGTDIKYSFVGDASAQCPNGCIAEPNRTVSPNGSIGGDGMASVLAHELVETVTDPDLNAWYDSSGEENADKCAWQFSDAITHGNGSLVNVSILIPEGWFVYYIQDNWLNAAGGGCRSNY